MITFVNNALGSFQRIRTLPAQPQKWDTYLCIRLYGIPRVFLVLT